MTNTVAALADRESARPRQANEHSRARERLDWHATVWAQKPLLRDIYRGYHERIRAAMSGVDGDALEVGAGHGSFAQFLPDVFVCDIVPCPWLDCAADAGRLPFRAATLANIVLVDVLHHLQDPPGFFNEAARVLAPGGRILILEPYTSPVSWIAWRFSHHERVDTSVRPLAEPSECCGLTSADPWDGNSAIPTLLFWRDLDEFHKRFPSLRVVRRDRFDTLLYPLSGGFEGRQLLPRAAAPLIRTCERLLTPLLWLLAFRCFIIVEKQAG